jgi:3-methyladenine DNA glycosylase AlkC
MASGVTKRAHIAPLIALGRVDPVAAFPEVRRLAASAEWQTREVAATALVEIAQRHPGAVLGEAARWAADADANVRRAASEGLRGLVRRDPEAVWPVLEALRADASAYVRKSVANLLRAASGSHADAVLALCRRWLTEGCGDPLVRRTVTDGLRKLRATHPREVGALLDAGDPAA